MLTHYLFTLDYFHILDTTSVLGIPRNVIDHCFSFTRSKCYKSSFLLWNQVSIKCSPLPTVQSNNLIPLLFICQIPKPHWPLQNHPCHFQGGHLGQHPRFYHNWSMSSLNLSSWVQRFHSNVGRHCYHLQGTLGSPPPLHCQHHNKAITLAKF